MKVPCFQTAQAATYARLWCLADCYGFHPCPGTRYPQLRLHRLPRVRLPSDSFGPITLSDERFVLPSASFVRPAFFFAWPFFLVKSAAHISTEAALLAG